MKRILISALILLFLVSCKTAEFGAQCIDVNGMVYDFENRPVPGYEVRLDEKRSSVTDITGRFTIGKVPVGAYQIQGTAVNYEAYGGELVLGDKRQIVYIRVPSAIQLLDLADKALTENRIEDARKYVERAESTGILTTEFLFYKAVVSFRSGDYPASLAIVDRIVSMGISDSYIIKFQADLNRIMEGANESGE